VTARGQSCVVDVAMPVGELREVFQEFGLTVLVLLPLGILLAAAGGYWISRSALAPVDGITSTARSITASNPGLRLNVPDTGDEMQRLAETLNAMLDRLEGAFRETTRFTADASHELRTPISLIRTSAELALRRERSVDEYRDALTGILRESERTTGLIENLLTLARADAAADGLQRSAVDVHALLAEIRPSLSDLCASKNLAFQLDDAGTPMEVFGDVTALRRLVLILVDNAVKYTIGPGQVTVSLADEANGILLTVEDTGIGIGPEDLPRVFDRFYRADKARTRDSGGAGLGLSIAKWIVERHGGAIEIVSEPERGCLVRVTLPRIVNPSPTMRPRLN